MKTSRKHIVWPSETEEQLGIGQVDSVTGEKKKNRGFGPSLSTLIANRNETLGRISEITPHS